MFELSAFLSFFTAIIGLSSTLHFSFGVLRQTSENIFYSSLAYNNANPEIRNSLVEQKVDYFMGFLTLVVTFILQILVSIVDFYNNDSH